MPSTTIEFTVQLNVLDATMKGIQDSRQLLAGNTKLIYGGESMPLSDALAEWLLQVLPQEVASISATIQLKTSPLDDASGGGGQVGTPGKSPSTTSPAIPRKVTRKGSPKPISAVK